MQQSVLICNKEKQINWRCGMNQKRSEATREMCRTNKTVALGWCLSKATKSRSTQGNVALRSNDKQRLMTCLSKAALITKGTFCCQERFCSWKTLESISFLLSLCCSFPGALPASVGQKTVLCMLGLRALQQATHKEPAGQKKKDIPTSFQMLF